jgi:hypothetical protein
MKLTPDLMISSAGNRWEVIQVDEDGQRARIRVHECRGGFQRYLDVGAEYPIVLHPAFSKDAFQVWEIPSEAMKRQVSQILLQWEDGVGFTIDMDM